MSGINLELFKQLEGSRVEKPVSPYQLLAGKVLISIIIVTFPK